MDGNCSQQGIVRGENSYGHFDSQASGRDLRPNGMNQNQNQNQDPGTMVAHQPCVHNNGERGKKLTSEDDEPCYKSKKNSRVKWMDKIVKLMITALSYIGEDSGFGNGYGRNFALLHKKGKWKSVSRVMDQRGYHVSPQQCEDKFNDLNKRYKKLNEMLGRGTSCEVVENPALLDKIDYLNDKEKDEVRKIMSSKQLFYEEMCSYHNGNRLHLPHDPALQRSLHLMTLSSRDDHDNDEHGKHQNDDLDDEDDHDDGCEEHHLSHRDCRGNHHGALDDRPLSPLRDSRLFPPHFRWNLPLLWAWDVTKMAGALRIHVSSSKDSVAFTSVTKQTFKRASVIRCAAYTPKKQYTIAVLPGDGVGNEVIPVAVEALRLAGSLEGLELSFEELPIGGVALDLVGVPLPEETLKRAKLSDAVLLGAVGWPKWDDHPKHLKPITGLLNLRAGLQVFSNLRPIRVFPQLTGSTCLRQETVQGVDLMIIRELTGGIYNAHPRGFTTNENGDEVGFSTESYSATEVDHIARVAFEIAKQRRGRLCSVDKAAILEGSMVWRKRVTKMASEYPEVDVSHLLIDTAAMDLIRHPKQFDIILTGVMFGDILSDLAAVIPGSVGLLPSASLGDSGPGIFEPVHGSAPKHYGKDTVNPLASVLSAVMLLRYGLKEENAAKRLEEAVFDVLDRGFRTRDIHTPGTILVGCKRMGQEILRSLDARVDTRVLASNGTLVY